MTMSKLTKTILRSSVIIFFSIFLLTSSCIHVRHDKVENSINIFTLLEKVSIKGIKTTVGVEVSSRAGSGVIISQDGHIVTNQHVVENSKHVTVTLANGDEYEAKVIGTDPKTDIALLKIDVDFPLTAAKFGNSDNVSVGSFVIAVGNPFGLSNSVSIGVVSGLKRVLNMGFYDNYIQTDASINPGSSGGPLFNSTGEVIGINTLIYTDSSKDNKKINIGIGFAIPINMVKDIIERLKEDGKVIRGSFGIIIQTISPGLQKEFGLKNRDGILVSNVGKNSAAEKGGLQRGDIIIKVNGKKVTNIVELSFTISMIRPGKEVAVVIIRDGKRKKLVIKVAEMINPEESLKIISRIEKSFGFTVGPITKQVIEDLSLENKEGVVILEVKEKSSAALAGIKDNDIIISINRKKVKNMDDYKEIMRKLDSKKQILVVINQGGITMYKVVKKR